MINTVRSLTRITPSTESLIDIIIKNKDNPELRAFVVDLGFSDHLAQIVRINIGKGNRRTKIVVRRQLTNNGIDELKNVLLKESWNEVFNHSDVNCSLKAFFDIFLYCFDIAF
jgi:Trm5-related predicted tRNA methylase